MASPVVDVYVKLPSGRTSVFKLFPTDIVRTIIGRIASEEAIPPLRVRLKYQGKFLDKTKTIGYLGIRPETILKADFVVPKDLRVTIKTPDGASAPIDIQNTNTLIDLETVVDSLDIVSPKKVRHFKISGSNHTPRDIPIYDTSITNGCMVDIFLQDGGETEASTNSDLVIDEDLKDAVLSSFETNGSNVEVVFSFDTTGSMNSYLARVRQNLRETCERLIKDIPNIRIGLIAHGDYCDYTNYVIKIQDLTTEVEQLVDFAENTSCTGGGDAPECYEWVLHKAKHLDWCEDSAKALVVIGDAEPHPPSYTDQNINWHSELEILKGMGIKVYGVHCNMTNLYQGFFYKELAEKTGGCYLKLNNFSLITEMFLGVCYKESNPEQLEAFTEELKQEGKLNEGTEILLKQLEDIKPEEELKKEETKSDVPPELHSVDWWNFDRDSREKPLYCYDADKDQWRPMENKLQVSSSAVTRSAPCVSGDSSNPISGNYVSKHLKRKSKRGCIIM